MSKVAAYYHVVFCTKHRKMTIPLEYREDLYRFIWKLILDAKCKLIRVGGIQNHVHILFDLHSDVALSSIIQAIKSRSSGWMVHDGRFPQFEGWASGYFACSISPEERPRVIEYIKNQQEHHLGHCLDDEVERLYRYAGIDYDERDMR